MCYSDVPYSLREPYITTILKMPPLRSPPIPQEDHLQAHGGTQRRRPCHGRVERLEAEVRAPGGPWELYPLIFLQYCSCALAAGGGGGCGCCGNLSFCHELSSYVVALALGFVLMASSVALRR